MHISTTWIYIAVIATAIALSVYSSAHPKKIAPFRVLFNYVMSHRISRFALLAIWWWVGWHFLAS